MGMAIRKGIFITLRVIGAAGIIGVAVVAPNALQGLDVLMGKKKKTNRSQNQRVLYELKRQKLVSVDHQEGGYRFKLTKNGAKRLAQLELDNINIPSPKKWDKKWRIISFDIPVQSTPQRAVLVHHLSKYDFLMLQRSTWAHYAPCFKQIQQITDYYGLTNYCAFIEVSEIDRSSQKRLRQHFGKALHS
ncbi:hypothetical protein A3A68_02550 [Candidatus Saccharibacteria bacterium RIFCSPLOWO2_01_FULL_48_13]|nr:MAG: hypothetical protein A3F38_01290 [Candidatus Saccharibacteria bacterium RIFCSPHIGHO2_12_FULL_48_21]OGL36720.1 MAG: hypothetical protein A3A68_02550 [Candidatus Saccharibacteria bacterium RIFCSPLOWO2_01_FULL_48_13]